MRNIVKCDDGVFLVPFGEKIESVYVDGVKEIRPDDQEYPEILNAYEREQLIEKRIKQELLRTTSKEDSNV